MARILITGSADGLGMLAARALNNMGHRVVLHARDAARARDALEQVPGVEDAFIGDLSDMAETRALAAKANASGRFDAVIYNAGIYDAPRNSTTADGLPVLFAVNSIAPYILTCLIERPKRIIYLSSDMHLSGNATLSNLPISGNSNGGHISYSDTKLHDLILAMAVARRWNDVRSNAVHPGWVPTKMGGAGAPDDLDEGYQTQVWLADDTDPATHVSGRYFYHNRQTRYLPAAGDSTLQERFLAACEKITGISFPV